ncbi:MAG: class I SAM-dependent methyltransferase [Rhizobiales bacterium]|nr:class I SAM-dependent methyltransferase [Hyphomicrobiales bacterium]
MKRHLDRLMARVFRQGRLQVTWADGSVSRYGEGDGRSAAILFRNERAERALLRNPELALGEAYMDGGIEFPDDTLLDFLLLANENWARFREVPFVAALARLRFAGRRWVQNNTPLKARRNVAHHYDLDERLYRLFLDRDMQYSCAYFETPGASLDEAQWAKKRHLTAKLDLKPGQNVLDIGSGWGGLGLYLAENAEVDVTGVTLSSEQHRVSNQRARDNGLERHVHFELQDYRGLDRTFDRIVSVGMFEHVGVARYGEFFRTVARLLKPDGSMVLHAIGRFEPPGATNPWIEKYIFPGGYIPALSEVLKAIEPVGLYVTDVEVLRLHYAETLKAWRERFRDRWEEAARIYDERFCRMWDFYLAGSEAAFREGSMMVFQIQLARSRTSVPLTRDYMFRAEAELNAERRRNESFRLAGE